MSKLNALCVVQKAHNCSKYVCHHLGRPSHIIGYETCKKNYFKRFSRYLKHLDLLKLNFFQFSWAKEKKLYRQVFGGLLIIYIEYGQLQTIYGSIQQYRQIKFMGNCCTSDMILHKNVLSLQNQIPNDQKYKLYQGETIRFSDLVVNRQQKVKKNQYKFVMKLLNQDTVQIGIVILNQKIQCAICQNYKLKIYKRMIIDIFDKSLKSTFIQAKNQRSGVDFSIKIFPFRGYTTQIFKKCIYNLHIIKNVLPKIQNQYQFYHKLIDFYVYGCNPDKQSLVFLYERAQTSLANIAQYRDQAQWPWTSKQKLKIFCDILKGVYELHRKKIYHRDIRPSNIIYIPRLQKFVIGSFQKAIQLSWNQTQQVNRTIYGIEYFSDFKIKKHIKEGKQYGPYDPAQMDYIGLKNVLNLLETNKIMNNNPDFQDKHLKKVRQLLERLTFQKFQIVFTSILKYVQQFQLNHVKLGEDDQISRLVSKLLSHTHKRSIQDYTFQIYDSLGYQKQFSDTAHLIIQKNNQNNKSLENAYLLKNLAQFFQRNGAKGTQYYCNACLLFLKRTQMQLDYGNLQKAQQNYYQAQKCYIKFSSNFQSHSSYIQLYRLKALLKLQQGKFDVSYQTITETFNYAATKNISIQKQMILLLSFAKIQNKGSKSQREVVLERLKNGLAICENVSAFQNASSCKLFTSNFLYQIGIYYFQNFKRKANPINKSKFDNQVELKGQIESNLKSCLQIRQRQQVDTIVIAQILYALGSYYYIISELSESKKNLNRAIIRYKQIKDRINPLKLIECQYLYGSCLYSLKQFSSAQREYHQSFESISRLQQNQSNSLLMYNIQGCIGLSQLQTKKKKQGQKNVFQALNRIKNLRGQNFYDYVFLKKKFGDMAR